MKFGKNQIVILRYIAEHPMHCKGLSPGDLAERIAHQPGSTAGVNNIYQGLRKLVKSYVVFEDKRGSSLLRDYSVNWNFQKLPKEIQTLAPTHLHEMIENNNKKEEARLQLSADPFGTDTDMKASKFIEKVKESGYDKTLAKLAEPSEEVRTWQKLKENLRSITSNDLAEAAQRLADDDSDSVVEEEPKTKPEPVQVQEPTVVKTADGKSISISLTINLNL